MFYMAAVYDDMFSFFLSGKSFNGVEVKLVDEAGKVVPYGSSGELVVRCSWRFAGYAKMPNAFHKSLDDSGWFHTGDIAHFRHDGNLVVNGRHKERLSIGTFKVFPWSVEKALRQCPGIMNVFVVGVPDQRMKQALCACVQLKEDVTLKADSIENYCEDTFLDKSMSMGISMKPKYILLFDSIPHTSSGKIDRRRIAIIAKDRLGLKDV